MLSQVWWGLDSYEKIKVQVPNLAKAIENNTITAMVKGGVGVSVRPQLDAFLRQHNIPETDENRTALVRMCAQTNVSKILTFLNERMGNETLDQTINRAMAKWEQTPVRTGFSDDYKQAVDALTDGIEKAVMSLK